MLSCLVALMLAVPASAISTRHDVPDDAYIVADDDYPAVVDLWPGDCSATLIRENALLTVAHCASDIRMGMVLDIAGEERAVSRVLLHPDYRGWSSDIAVVFIDAPVAHVTPHALYTGTDELDQTLTLVGQGLHATGLEGERDSEMDFQLRRAQNVVTLVNEHWLEVTFDDPDDGDALPLEGVGMGGDSGGPAFIETPEGLVIAGLNSWGDAPAIRDIGKYNSWDYSTRVSTYLDWVEGVLGEGPAPVLEVAGTCGERVTMTLSGFTSGGRVALVSAPGLGSAPVLRGPCRGIALDMAEPLRQRMTLSVDADGAAVVEAEIPGGACGVSMQAMDLTTCAVSPTHTF
jgi:hypothetical protein